MNTYTLTLWALLLAVGLQIFAAGVGVECYLRCAQPTARRRAWLALTGGSLLLALHHAYWLELAVRTGLYDLRQAVLAALAGGCFALAVYAFRRGA
ncbi:MAG: hypothetical protein FWF20_08970 [Betaproteobacteria bacterium]|nr:hypothetical protein [Betaproteobacteria bacterium]MCL2886894.1 hypothetical protein [Betaproteobacteria bacterium]